MSGVRRRPFDQRLVAGGMLVAPAIALIAGVTLLPLVMLVFRLAGTEGVGGVGRVLADGLHRKVMIRTVEVSASVTFICLVAGYPVALFLTVATPRVRKIMVLALALPMAVSVLIRSYAWLAVLGRSGPINKGLEAMGLIEQPLQLVFNRFGITVGMVAIMLPITIFPLYGVMRQIDPVLLEAAVSMGARPLKAIATVLVPLSVPGIVAGSIVVFVLSLGFYVTPAVLGGPKDQLIAQLIESDVRSLFDWQAAAVTGITLTLLTLAAIGVGLRLVPNYRLPEE